MEMFLPKIGADESDVEREGGPTTLSFRRVSSFFVFFCFFFSHSVFSFPLVSCSFNYRFPSQGNSRAFAPSFRPITMTGDGSGDERWLRWRPRWRRRRRRGGIGDAFPSTTPATMVATALSLLLLFASIGTVQVRFFSFFVPQALVLLSLWLLHIVR